MELILIRHLWGVECDWALAFKQFKQVGYRGAESRMPPREDRARLRRLLAENDLAFIPQVFSEGDSVAAHVDSIREQVAEAKTYRPLFINAHSGRDAFNEDESVRYFEGVLKIEARARVRIVHETHRGRILFNPWITARLLARFDSLKLCCDFSHWVCVCERLIDDQIDIIRQSARHCAHLHARVGYEQGPQVPDPRAPEYQAHLLAHERWWQMVWDEQRRRGERTSTLTPEFGPADYLHTLPFTRVPVANLTEICDWQARRQAENFARGAQRKRPRKLAQASR